MKHNTTSLFLSLGIHLLLLILLCIPTAQRIIHNNPYTAQKKSELLRLIPTHSELLSNNEPQKASEEQLLQSAPEQAQHIEIANMPSIPVLDHMLEASGEIQDNLSLLDDAPDDVQNAEPEELPDIIEHVVKTINNDIPKLNEEPEIVAENMFTEALSKLWSGKTETPQKKQSLNTAPEMTREERAQKAIAALLKKENPTTSARTIIEKARENIKPTVKPRTTNTSEAPTGRAQAGVAGFKRMDNDMRYASYQTRISSHIASSHRIFMNQLPEMQKQKLRALAIRGELTVALSIVINKDGTLKECRVTRSSGDPFIDEVFLSFQRFLAPYPRIPDHLNISTFRISGDFHFPL